MKRSRQIALLGMGFSVLALTSCDDPNEIVPVKAYATVDECISDGFSKVVCARSLSAAQEAYDKAYPKYASEEDCEDKTGTGNCEKDYPSRRDSAWRPAMLGFILAGSRVQPQAVIANPAVPGGRATAAGVPISGSGSAARMPLRGAAAPSRSQVAKAQTQSRGGFGSTATRVSTASTGGSRSSGG